MTISTDGASPSRPIVRYGLTSLVLLALLSYLLGFGIVLAFHVINTPEPAPAIAHSQEPCAPPAPAAPATQATTDSDSSVDEETGTESAGDDTNLDNRIAAAEMPPEVPPGRTPPNIRLDGEALYHKCWTSEGELIPGEQCDRLRVFEKRLENRLYIIDRCRKDHLGEDALGLLSLGAEIDWSGPSVSFWAGPSSTLPNIRAIAACLRDELAGIPLYEIDHKYEKYRLFFSVNILDQEKMLHQLAEEDPKVNARKNKQVKVNLDRVNVREEPVDGPSIGKINAGNLVILLGRKNDWCHVLTPGGNKGWMICEALDL